MFDLLRVLVCTCRAHSASRQRPPSAQRQASKKASDSGCGLNVVATSCSNGTAYSTQGQLEHPAADYGRVMLVPPAPPRVHAWQSNSAQPSQRAGQKSSHADMEWQDTPADLQASYGSCSSASLHDDSMQQEEPSASQGVVCPPGTAGMQAEGLQPALPALSTAGHTGEVASTKPDPSMHARHQQEYQRACSANGAHTGPCRACPALRADLEASRDQVYSLQKQLQASQTTAEQLRSQLASAKEDLSSLRSTLSSLASVRDQEKQDTAMKHLRAIK
jgi:hypothetical protein